MTTLLEKPLLTRNDMVLRPYQAEDVDRIRAEMVSATKKLKQRIANDPDMSDEAKAKARRHPRILYTLATGLGKTPVICQIFRLALENGNRCCYLAHRKELIDQPVNMLDMFGISADIEKASQNARELYEPDAVVASVQTMRGDRLLSWDPDYFDLLAIDECHHACTDSYMNVLNHFADTYVVGVTATADRFDEEDLGQVFDATVIGMNLWEGIKSKFLCDLRIELYDADVDLRGLRAQKGDFTDKHLEERIAPMIGQLANGIYEKAGDRPTLNFLPQIKSSMAMATALQSLGVNAQWVSGDDPNRDAKVKAYRRGDLQMLCAANLFLEGTDLPETAAIGLMRPTKSRPTLSQIVGRGTRLKEKYPDCILIDFNFITDQHDLVKPIELFDMPNLDRGVIEAAQKALEQNPELSLAVAFEMGEKKNAERKILEIKAEKKKVKWDCVSYRPMQAFETLGLPWRGMRDAQAQPPSQRQVDFLEKLGVEGAGDLSKTRASTLLDYIVNRGDAVHADGSKGYATLKQVRWMIRQGMAPAEARNMSKKAACEWMGARFQKFSRYKRKG